MIFELDKEYIVKVTKEGIIPVKEFDSEKYYNKDTDDLDFLTDEEKDYIIREFARNLVKKMDKELKFYNDDLTCKSAVELRININKIIHDYANMNKE